MPETKVKIDLTDCKSLVAAAETLMDGVDQVIYPVDPFSGPARRNNPELAQAGRDLLEIAHRLQHAASEAELQYYRLKGKFDPRFEDDHHH